MDKYRLSIQKALSELLELAKIVSTAVKVSDCCLGKFKNRRKKDKRTGWFESNKLYVCKACEQPCDTVEVAAEIN